MERAVSVIEMLREIERRPASRCTCSYSEVRPGDQPLYISDTAKLEARHRLARHAVARAASSSDPATSGRATSEASRPRNAARASACRTRQQRRSHEVSLSSIRTGPLKARPTSAAPSRTFRWSCSPRASCCAPPATRFCWSTPSWKSSDAGTGAASGSMLSAKTSWSSRPRPRICSGAVRSRSCACRGSGSPRSTAHRSVVVIGPHGSVTPLATLEKTGADIVLRGEPDQTLPQLASTALGDDRRLLLARRATEPFRISTGPGRRRTCAPSAALDYSDYPVERHHTCITSFPATERTTCSWARRWSSRAAARTPAPSATRLCFATSTASANCSAVLAEIDQLIARGVDYIYFIDEIFGVGKQVRELLEEIAKRPVSIGFQIAHRSLGRRVARAAWPRALRLASSAASSPSPKKAATR